MYLVKTLVFQIVEAISFNLPSANYPLAWIFSVKTAATFMQRVLVQFRCISTDIDLMCGFEYLILFEYYTIKV